MTVLVTGASGFIGTPLAQRLSASGSLVALGDLSIPGATIVTARLEELTPETWQRHGIESFSCVYHLGGFALKRRDGDDVERVYADNLEGTRRLLESLPPTRRIVLASTIDVYAAGTLQLSECSPVGPSSLYGASKLFVESLVRWWAERAGSEAVILRVGHVFGPGEQRYERLVPATIRTLLRGRPPVIRGDGSAERDLIYVADVVEAFVRAGSVAQIEHDVINVVRGASVAVRDVVDVLAALTGYVGPVRHVASDREISLHFDATRMVETLGSWQLTSLEDGLREEVTRMAPEVLRA